MDLDVKRIAQLHLEMIVEVMDEAKTVLELDETYEDAKDALGSLYSAIKARLGN